MTASGNSPLASLFSKDQASGEGLAWGPDIAPHTWGALYVQRGWIFCLCSIFELVRTHFAACGGIA